MFWYITKKSGKDLQKNAAGKAPGDVDMICQQMKLRKLNFPIFPAHWKNGYLQKLWIITLGTIPWFQAELKIKKGDTILLPFPFYGNRVTEKMMIRMKKRKNAKFIILIHDLESLRNIHGQELDYGRYERGVYAEKKILPLADAIISHNKVMSQYLAKQGISEEKIVELEIFDYLTECNPERAAKSEIPSIAIAGNLSPIKSSYLYSIKENKNDLQVNLYGVGFDQDKVEDCLIYHGSFAAEKLPEYLTGDFGLVWDGISAETCVGGTGEYLRYNNPHKTSLYLASNMPVVLWEQSAMATFIKEKKLGITVKSISEISDKIKNLTEKEWQTIHDNVIEEGKRLRNGYYTKKALKKAYSITKNMK